MKKYHVELNQVKNLFYKKLPPYIVFKLVSWAKRVEMIGLPETRKITGFHDEPLQGQRIGQRSIRLNQSYRAIYKINEDEKIVLVIVIEVNKHDY